MNETQENKKFDFGAVAGSVIIVVLLLLAGWYFYQEIEKINDDLDIVNRPEINESSNDLATPESVNEELLRNPFDEIENELSDIEAEFEAESEVSTEVQ